MTTSFWRERVKGKNVWWYSFKGRNEFMTKGVTVKERGDTDVTIASNDGFVLKNDMKQLTRLRTSSQWRNLDTFYLGKQFTKTHHHQQPWLDAFTLLVVGRYKKERSSESIVQHSLLWTVRSTFLVTIYESNDNESESLSFFFLIKMRGSLIKGKTCPNDKIL